MGILVFGLVGSNYAQSPRVASVLIVLLCIIFALYVVAYLYFAFKEPDRLQSESYSISMTALQKGYTVTDEQIYTDEAASGARKDRAGLNALMHSSGQAWFDIVIVDDLSRLARDNYLMLSSWLK